MLIKITFLKIRLILKKLFVGNDGGNVFVKKHNVL